MRRRLGVELAQADPGEAEARSGGATRERPVQDRDEHRGRGLLRRLVQGGDRQRVPQAPVRLRRLTQRSEPLRHAGVVEVSPRRPPMRRAAGAARLAPGVARHAQKPDPLGEGQAGEAQQPRRQVPGGREAGQVEGGQPPPGLYEGQLQARLEPEPVACSQASAKWTSHGAAKIQYSKPS